LEVEVCDVQHVAGQKERDGLSRCTQQVLAVDILELDTKLVTAMAGNKLFGLVYKNMSGMA